MKRIAVYLVALLAVGAPVAFGQNSVTKPMLQSSAFDPNIAGDWIWSGTLLLPAGTTPSSTQCDEVAEAGRVYVDTDATSGQQLYVCEGLSGWILQGAAPVTGGVNCADARVVCVGKDATAEYSTICGITIGAAAPENDPNIQDAICVAGSALGDITDSASQSYDLYIGPGTYRETVAINIPNVNLFFSPGALLELTADPNVIASANTAANGELRVGNAVARHGYVSDILIQGAHVRHHFTSAPESGLQLGAEGGFEPLADGTFQIANCAGCSSTEVDISNWYNIVPGMASLDNSNVGCAINITGGCGSGGDSKTITAYDGTTRIATVDSAFSGALSNTCEGELQCFGTGWTRITTRDNVFIGVHDGGQAYGSEDPNLPLPVWWSEGDTFISGSDALALKGELDFYGRDMYALAQTNYCRTSPSASCGGMGACSVALATVTGAVQFQGGGSVNSFVLEAADDPGIDKFYRGRLATFGTANVDDNVCPADGLVCNVNGFTSSTDTVNCAAPNLAASPDDPDCTYSIAAMGQGDEEPACTVPWAHDRAAWKTTAFHGSSGGTIRRSRVSNSVFEWIVNDFGRANGTTGNCVFAQLYDAGILIYGSAAEFYNFDNVTIRGFLNSPRNPSNCTADVSGIAVVAGAVVTDELTFNNGSIELFNGVDGDGDADANLIGVGVSADSGNVRVSNTRIRIRDAVGTTGNVFHLWKDNAEAATLEASGIVSPDPLLISGTIGSAPTYVGGIRGSVTEDLGDPSAGWWIEGSTAEDLADPSAGWWIEGTGVEDLADPSGACIQLSTPITVTGAALGDSCVLGTSAALPSGVAGTCHVTATDTAQVVLCGSGDPASMTYTAHVIKETACIEGSAITVTGAALGDSCVLGTSAALPSGVAGTCHVTATNTAKVSLCGSGDPASMTYTARVVKETACIEGSAVTVTGAALGDVCLLGTSAALPSGVAGSCLVTAADTAKVSLCGSGDPASMTYTLKVLTP